REVEADRCVATLAGEAGSTSAAEHRRAMRATDREGLLDVFEIARNHDADRGLPIIRSIGCIQRAASTVESNFAPDGCCEIGGEATVGDVMHDVPQTDNRCASWRLNSMPRPGRERSGRSSPRTGSRAPS